jgi:1A family penicillin-binding protein
MVLAFLVLAVLAGALGSAWALTRIINNLPKSTLEIENYLPAGRSMIYSSDGILLAQVATQNRQTVTIDHIPMPLQNATVAIEDSRFYSNHGIDFRGITRALFHNISSDTMGQGGSTITQQLVRNLGIAGLGHEKTFSRKVKEVVYAFKIDQNFSKQQILEMYLNQVYYGSGAYGVQAASETYFGKPAEKLDLAQCALIAGLPQRPSGYSPYVDKAAAMTRRNIVLGRMRDLAYISADQCATAQEEPIILAFPKAPSTSSKIYRAPYFVNYVLKQLTNKYGSDFILRGGLNVTTTLNYQMQQAAESAVTNGISSVSYLGVTDAALVAMDQKTGYIKAMVGGISYQKSQFNIAADGRRQPGSSFKPVIYTAALDSGLISERETISNAPLTLPGANGKDWSPKDDPGPSPRNPTALEAVAESLNIPAVRVLREVGVDTAIHYASMMGIKSPLAPYLTLALGSSAVTPLEMCRMYALIANQGQLPTPIAIEKIVQSDGTPLEEDQPELETTSISVNAFKQMDDMLRAVVTSDAGTAHNVFADGNPPDVRGKTGTTQEHRDVWFDGYTSKLTCVVWAGHPSKDERTGRPVYLPMTGVAFGATICAPIWKQFMVAANTILAAEAAREAAHKKPAAPTTAAEAPAANSPASPSTSPTPLVEPASGSGQSAPPSDPTADVSSDGKSVTVWVDDSSGLRATPNSAGSHQETFAAGMQPTTYADGSSVSSAVPKTTHAKSDQSAPSSTTTTLPGSTPTYHAATVPSPSAPAAPAKMVTVTICVESGMRATEWCPETIDKQYPANKIPKYCTLHKPPPGE